MNKEELDRFEEKFHGNDDALRLVSHIKELQTQIDRMFEIIQFLEEDVERLKGKRFELSKEDKMKIIDFLDTKAYKNIAGMMNFLINDDLKQQYISIEDSPYLLYPKKIELTSRTSTHDVFHIVMSVGHECPHDKAYFVEDDEISIFKELPR